MAGRPALVALVAWTLLLTSGTASAWSPPFPGAKRRADPAGRWYATVERASDRCALVERAAGSPQLPTISDSGLGRVGDPSPVDPIRPGDRVVVRARVGSYPLDLLPASDGSGFATVTREYGPPGFPTGQVVGLLSWIPARGPRVAVPLPDQGEPPAEAVWSRSVPWRIDAVHAPGLVAVSGWPDRPATVVRFADGAVRRVPFEKAADLGAAERALETPPRAAFDPGTGPAAEARVLGAMRGDPALGLDVYQRASVIARAYDLLGPDAAGPALLARFEGPETSAVDPERNVVRAAYGALLSRPEGIALARATLLDRARPAPVRVLCAWILSEALAKDDLQPLIDAALDPDPLVAGHAGSALADRRWEAGPVFLRFLSERKGDDRVVAQYFADHRIAGSEQGLLAALRRAPRGSELRATYLRALVTQTNRDDLGDDPGAWERVLRSPAK